MLLLHNAPVLLAKTPCLQLLAVAAVAAALPAASCVPSWLLLLPQVAVAPQGTSPASMHLDLTASATAAALLLPVQPVAAGDT